MSIEKTRITVELHDALGDVRDLADEMTDYCGGGNAEDLRGYFWRITIAYRTAQNALNDLSKIEKGETKNAQKSD